eukprot:9488809-Lingulodinium_polyedra.AAC.1
MASKSRASADKRQHAGMAQNSAIPSRRRGTLGRLRTPRPARGQIKHILGNYLSPFCWAPGGHLIALDP